MQNFEIKAFFFSKVFISVSRDFTPYFHFRCVARATFGRNLIHSADACFLVMACVGYLRAQLKTLSSLLEAIYIAFHLEIKKNCANGPLFSLNVR